MPPVDLSVAIITLDEADNLPRCLRSIEGLADEVVVVDSLSTDGTQQIARAAGARVLEQEFLGHRAQKQLALEQARGEWILCLDADEWLDDALRDAVRGAVADAGGRDGFHVNRRTFHLGGWIDHCGWSPEWRLRLVRRGRGGWEGVDPHDRLVCDGPTGRLAGRLNHRPYRDFSHHLQKVDRYTDIMVARRREAGEEGALAPLVLRPPARFLRMYVLQGGWRDGWRGFVVCAIGGYYVFLKYAKLLEASRVGDGAGPGEAA